MLNFMCRGWLLALAGVASIVLSLALSGAASAAPNTFCSPPSGTTGTTTYTGSDGNWGDGDNWSSGLPDGQCNAVIPAGDMVTLTTTPGTESDTFAGASAAALTINPNATLIVEGVSSNGEQGNVAQSTDLNVGGGGLTVDQGAKLDIEATGNVAPSGDDPGQTPGGSANVGVDSASSAPAPVTNDGTIEASSSDPAWGESLNVGGTLTNTGSIIDASGLLTFQGQQNLPYVVDNPGTMSVASGAAFTMLAGDGSSFDNDGTFANNGTATLQQTMHWVQSGGSETGNPVQLTGPETLEDSVGTGSFEVTNCTTAGLAGTIPAGQTVSVLGGCSGTTLSLGSGSNPAPVLNDGSLILDAPSNGSDAIVEGAELDNHGTLDSTIAGAKLANQLLVPLVNEAGATVDVSGGTLEQTAGTATSNAGTVNITPAALWLVQAGSFTNTGTLVPQIASATSLGQFNLTVGSKFTAGGTLAPSLVSGFAPATGTEVPFITLNGGSVNGTFSSVTGGFSADYSKETATPPYLGLVYGGSSGTGPARSAGAPSVGKVRGGAGKITFRLSCASRAGSCTYKATGTVTEHFKGKKLVAVAAKAKKSKSKSRVVVVGSTSGRLAPGKSATVTLKLNRTGTALLKRFHKLKVRVVITSGRKVVSKKTVTTTRPKTKPKKKKKKK